MLRAWLGGAERRYSRSARNSLYRTAQYDGAAPPLCVCVILCPHLFIQGSPCALPVLWVVVASAESLVGRRRAPVLGTNHCLCLAAARVARGENFLMLPKVPKVCQMGNPLCCLKCLLSRNPLCCLKLRPPISPTRALWNHHRVPISSCVSYCLLVVRRRANPRPNVPAPSKSPLSTTSARGHLHS